MEWSGWGEEGRGGEISGVVGEEGIGFGEDWMGRGRERRSDSWSRGERRGEDWERREDEWSGVDGERKGEEERLVE